MIELRNFVFDQETNINVDALEQYLNQNKDQIMESEQELNIDMSSMIKYGPIETAQSAEKANVADPSGQ
jgi:hypothetical protein